MRSWNNIFYDNFVVWDSNFMSEVQSTRERERERETVRRENIFSSSKQMVNVCAKIHVKRRRTRLQMRFGYRSNELKFKRCLFSLSLSLSFTISHVLLPLPDSIAGIFQRRERVSVNGGRFREGFTTIPSEMLNLLTNYFEIAFYVRNWFAWNFINIPVAPH